MNSVFSRIAFSNLILIFFFFLSCNRSVKTESLDFSQLTGPDTLILTNGLLIDGTGKLPVSNSLIIIRKDRIVYSGAYIPEISGKKLNIYDLSGKTILPGLINSHVHYAFNPDNLRKWAQVGITTVRDESYSLADPARNTSETGLKERLEKRRSDWNKPEFARLLSSGAMLCAPKGYGQLCITDEQDGIRKVREEVDAGVDFIKISLEDGYAGTIGLPKLKPEVLKAVVEEAHRLGKKVSGHITSGWFVDRMLDTGADDIAHIPYDRLQDQTISRMVSNKIWLIPTFSVYSHFGVTGETVNNLHKFYQAGGKIAFGDDYGGGPGQFDTFPIIEFKKMSEAGMTPTDIITASTANGAKLCGIDKNLGALEPGKIADLLIIHGNPLENILEISNTYMVIKDGVVIRQK